MDEMNSVEAAAKLESFDVAHIGTAAEGVPYVTPISFVVLGNELLFRTAGGKRMRAIRSHPLVCVEASRWNPDGNWESVIATGEAYVVDDPHREADVVAALLDKYRDATESALAHAGPSPLASPPITVAVPLTEITGRTSGSGLNPRSRPGRL